MTLDQIVEQVQRRLGNFGTPPDKECIKAVLSVLTVGDIRQLEAWTSHSWRPDPFYDDNRVTPSIAAWQPWTLR